MGLYIGAPVGNYVSHPGAVSIIGTYTVERRAGLPRRIYRVARTLRYQPGVGWTNKLGLPNPGIDSLVGKDVHDKVLSIHGFDGNEWNVLLGRALALEPAAVELDVSCPNVGELSVPENLFCNALKLSCPVIVKLPPVNWRMTYAAARHAGVSWFHLSNTLPVEAGGLSGKALKAINLDNIRWIRSRGTLSRIIGGGGIYTPQDIEDYRAAGADDFAVVSALLNPLARKRRLEALVAETKGA